MAGQKPDDRDKYIGQRIAEQRRRASLTQRSVAKNFGISAAQLQKYEKGTNRISAVHLDIIARMTGMPVDYFFQGMTRFDAAACEGFGEDAQASYAAGGQWQGLAEVVAQYVAEHFNEEARRDFAAAVKVLDQKLNG